MKEENIDAMKYRKSTHLAGVDVDMMDNKILTIKKCWYETNVDVSGNKTSGYFIEFNQPVKDMLVNSTNRAIITKVVNQITGWPMKDCRNIGNWAGIKIELFFNESIKMMGKVTGGIRIKEMPVVLPEMNPDNNRWDGAKKALLAGTVTIEQIKNNYSLSPENEALILKADDKEEN